MKKVIIVALAVVMSFVIGCGSSNTPSAVVKAYYQNVADGNVDDAFKLLSKEAQAMLTKMAGGAEALKQPEKSKKKDGLKNIEILNEEITGEKATVKIKITRNDGKSSEMIHELIIEDGNWRIAMDK